MANAARMAQIEAAQTSIAKKVLSVVPMAEYWSLKQIMSELVRQGTGRDMNIVSGCLTTLLDCGLIRRKDGAYQRINYKTNEEPMEKPPATLTATPTPLRQAPAATADKPVIAAVPAPSGLDRLIAAGTRARYLGQELINLAEEIDEAVLQAEEEAAAKDAEFTKLRQLSAILKTL